MPKQQHHNEDEQYYQRGANFDDDASILASAEKGFYVDAQNMRPTELGGHGLATVKIKGETLLYPNTDNRCNIGSNQPILGNYECIASITVINHVVEIWADRDRVELPFIRIDGWIVLYPKLLTKFPISVDFPPQVHKNDSCIGGEICVTDDNIPPYVLNVEDMLKNSGIDPKTNLRDTVTYPCTQKYFNDFDIAKYQTQLNRPLDHPVFIEVTPTGTPNAIGRTEIHGSGGIKVGSYQYSIRFANAAGDITPFSESTPLIPLPKGLSGSIGSFPGIKTYGAAASTNSGFGIHMRFRVVNILDFETIEIKRTSWNLGAALGTLGLEEIVYKVLLAPGELSIVDFYDYDNSFLNPATPEEVVDNLSSIDGAKAIRYYNSRLFLMNIKYASRDVTDKVLFDQISAKEMIPFTFSLSRLGYSDIWNDVYKKSHMRGEKFGYASVFFGENGDRSFALDIPNSTNVKMPERRDPMNNDNLKLSVTPLSNSAYEVAEDKNGNISRTFEVFDLIDSVTKNIHYADNGGTGPDNYSPSLNILKDGSKDHFIPTTPPYGVFHPISDSDPNVAELDLIINPEVKVDGTGHYYTYNPKGFAPNYYSLGIALAGIKQMPVWVKAFSLVRSAPAGRVVAQGQSFYQMNDESHANIEKRLDKVWWQSPDLYHGLVSYSGQIQSQLSSLRVQAVSAVGFFTEVYSGMHNQDIIDPTVSTGIDMINYCRVLRDDGEINLVTGSGSLPVVGINAGGVHYTAFERWRNSIASPVAPNSIFTPSNILPDGRGSQHRGKPYTIQLTTPLYTTQATSGEKFYESTQVMEWHESVYVMNIINPNVDVPPTSGTKEFFETGSYIKVESIIGLSDGNTQSYYLVDERWQDCIPSLKSWHPTNQDDRYVFINDGNNNEDVWLNITNKLPATITAIKNTILANGFYVSTQPDGTQFSVKGLYTHVNVGNGDRYFTINFNQTDANGVPFIPAKGNYIIVRYNHNVPVEIFGGDAYIADFNYCPVDAKLKNDIDFGGHLIPEQTGVGGDEIYIDRPMPYHDFHIDENVCIIRDEQGINKIQDNNKIKFVDESGLEHGRLRQQLVGGIVECRINIALDFGNKFPAVNYIMRPYIWNTNNLYDHLYDQYTVDYPDEGNAFGWGGFRFKADMEVDYSTNPVNFKHYSKPVGFKEITHYCSRIIWSMRRPINKMGAPGLLTFPSLQIFDLGDETGEINFAYDSLSTRYGHNLYAFTDHGVSLLVTEKSILTEMTGAQLASIASNNTTEIQQALWISKSIGMPDEFWRSKAEWNNILWFSNKISSYKFGENTIVDIGAVKYYTKVKSILDKVEQDYVTDLKAVYDVRHHEYWYQISQRVIKIGNQFSALQPYAYLVDTSWTTSPPPGNLAFKISADSIISIVNNTITDIDLSYLQLNDSPIYICNNQTLPITIHYDPDFNYLAPAFTPPGPTIVFITIQPGECYKLEIVPLITRGYRWKETKISLNLSNLPVWSEKSKETWIGEFEFEFDKYTTVDDRMMGSRNVETWELDRGGDMNGKQVEAWVLQATSGGAEHMRKSKEFFRIRIGGEVKPTKVKFYDTIEQFNSGDVQAELDSATNPQFYLKDYGAAEQYIPRRTAQPRNRMQGTKMLFQLIHDTDGEFIVPYTVIEFKDLV